jgi:cyclic-di-GMP-binding protein
VPDWVHLSMRIAPSQARPRELIVTSREDTTVASEAFFDIVSKTDRQEVDNALNQAAKEVANRFDFRNVDAGIKWSGQAVEIQANSEERAKAVLDVFKDKLVKRGVSLKAIDPGDPKPSGKIYRLGVDLKEGISQENAKKISKIIRDEGPRGVRAQIQGDELRVSSKKKDDLQQIINLLKGKDLDVALQFTNYR